MHDIWQPVKLKVKKKLIMLTQIVSLETRTSLERFPLIFLILSAVFKLLLSQIPKTLIESMSLQSTEKVID